MARTRRGFGAIRKLPSGRFQASYTGPDTRRHNADSTFDTRMDAEAWLSRRRSEVVDGVWKPGRAQAKGHPTFAEYSSKWLSRRTLKPRTLAHYTTILEKFILPELGGRRLRDIEPDDVAEWHHGLRDRTGNTYRAHAYSLARAIFRSAAAEDLITASPCRVSGAGGSKRKSKTEPPTLAELEAIVAAMPANLRVATLLAAWCGLRFGELFELRRKDVDLKAGVIRVRRGVVRSDGTVIVGDPKTEAGRRDVAIPPHLLPSLDEHLQTFSQAGREGLLFPGPKGEQWASSSLYWHWHKARGAADRDDLRWHDLRHLGAVLAAQTGATIAELMARLGHSTPAAAMRYQHAAKGRDQIIAERLSAMVNRDR